MTHLRQQSARTRVPPVPRTAPDATVDDRHDPDPTVGDLQDLDREAALVRLFDLHYTALLRLAVLLGADDAENVVAEAYCQLYRRWQRLRNADAALAYLRSVVCNLTRMRLRHLQVVRRHTEPVTDSAASAESIALLQDDHRALVEALQRLPERQREALVLRHWLGLRETEIAAAMGISVGAVKSHTARGIAKLTRLLEARR
ncbi:hypothetical protein GCM10027290_02900 [Micromonospora sonneratiae]|uniref:SigE family RNA polymerase sigma factor n=1 Tax=Micromonospora sonneratiae TaxID=1184706 RepID=A0ABW3Y6K9_9ACTN